MISFHYLMDCTEEKLEGACKHSCYLHRKISHDKNYHDFSNLGGNVLEVVVGLYNIIYQHNLVVSASCFSHVC